MSSTSLSSFPFPPLPPADYFPQLTVSQQLYDQRCAWAAPRLQSLADIAAVASSLGPQEANRRMKQAAESIAKDPLASWICCCAAASAAVAALGGPQPPGYGWAMQEQAISLRLTPVLADRKALFGGVANMLTEIGQGRLPRPIATTKWQVRLVALSCLVGITTQRGQGKRVPLMMIEP